MREIGIALGIFALFATLAIVAEEYIAHGYIEQVEAEIRHEMERPQ